MTLIKICTVCSEVQGFANFYNYKASKDGKSYRCKFCDNKARAKWKEANPERAADSAKYRNIKHSYGLSREDYDGMVEAQQGKCKICQKAKGRMVVDHCHTTGRVRGILCNSCNRGLGYFGDDTEVLEAAYNYLEINLAETH